MVTAESLRKDIQTSINEAGGPVRIRYFTQVFDENEFDNETSLVSGVDVWTSGVKQPINNREDFTATKDFNMEPGTLKSDYSKLYLLADITLSGTFKIGIGSPINYEYSTFKGGIKTWNVQNEDVYHKVYIKALTNGSLIGE